MYPKKWFYDTNAPQRHREFVVADNRCDVWQENYEALKAKYDDNGLIGLIGTRGSGKTQASVVLIAINSSLDRVGLYVKAQNIFLDIRDAGHNGCLSETVKRFIEPHLLIIDAFQMRSGTDFEQRTILNILDSRYDCMKPTVIISNDTIKEFANALGDDGFSRMQEGGGVIEFKSTDFRGRV